MLKNFFDFFKSNKNNKLPTHVSIITDGNGRWAIKKNFPRYIGHIYGSKNISKIINYSQKIGIKFLSFYIFSKENWNRDTEEILILMNLLEKYLTKYIINNNKNINLKIIGDYENLPNEIIDLIKTINDFAISNTNFNITVILCVNYSGRSELLNVIKKIIKNKINWYNIDESIVNKYLYTHDIPDTDFIIRTSGEKRLSNFFTWQSIYSELYFTNVLWPDFTINDFEKALFAYSKRLRRFGKT